MSKASLLIRILKIKDKLSINSARYRKKKGRNDGLETKKVFLYNNIFCTKLSVHIQKKDKLSNNSAVYRKFDRTK